LISRISACISVSDFPGAKALLDELCALTGESVGFHFLSVEQLCAPPEPVRYVVEALDFCPGRPAQIVGTGFSGKTLAGQSLVMSVITGRPVWGTFAAAQGPCVHLDYEMGRRASLTRYRRLAVGMGVSWETDVAPNLRFASLPAVKLTTPNVLDLLCEAADGRAIVLIDSLRRATPGVNENESAITSNLDILTSASERTGATFVVVHHASTKASPNGESVDPRGAGRGSSAIYDAAGAVLLFTGTKADPVTRVTHTKAPERGTPLENFGLRIADVEANGDPRAGIVVTHERVEPRSGVAGQADHVSRVVAVVDGAGPAGVTGADKVAVLASMRGQSARTALKLAVGQGLVEQRGSSNRPVFVGAQRPSSSRPR
jgi:hypothetical protein